MSSLQETTNVSVVAGDPIWLATKTGFSENISAHMLNWQHQIAANGGYTTATLTLVGNVDWMDDWFFHGLGRDITLYDSGLNVIWQGYINKITYNYGSQAMIWGPLNTVANRIKLIYTPYIDITVDPPTSGTAQESIYTDDTASQDQWGIREAIISSGNLIVPATVGGGGADEATQVRNAYLEYMKSPEKSQEVQYGGDANPAIVFECLGYSSMLDAFTHTDNNTGYQTFTQKMLATIASDPNSVFSTDYSLVETNALLIAKKDRNRTATTIFNEIAAQGDVNYARWLWGITKDRKLYYGIAPTMAYYIYQRGLLYSSNMGVVIQPWQVIPGQWIFYADMVHKSASTVNASLTVDPQSSLYGFIEAVNFTSPYSIQISGRRISTIGQLLAQKGLSL